MMKTRVEFFDRSLLFGPSGAFGPAARAEMLAEFAREQIAAVDAQNAALAGRNVPRETIVDGARTDDLSRVRPDGVIVARWEVAIDLIQWIIDLIRRSGPVLSGDYRKFATIFADRVEVASVVETIGASEIVILSLVPYARKIERGRDGYAPGHVYEAVAALAAARFGNIARIKFTYREPFGSASSLEAWARRHSAKAPTPGKQRRQYAKDVRQPAVVISF